MKTFADLKRNLQVGKELILVERFGQRIENPQPRKIIKVQSNAIVIEKLPGSGKESRLYFPPSSLIEITEKGFKIYYPGKRDLTLQELDCLINQPQDPKQEEIDALSDGNVMFWRREEYFKEHDALYLRGYKEEKGLKYDFNDGKVRDNKIKGDLALEYIFGNGNLS